MFGRLYQRLSFWLPTLDETLRPEFDRIQVYVNLRRQRILVWVFVSIHLAIICQYFVRTGSVGSPYIAGGELSLFLCCMVFLIAAGRPTSPAEINRHHRFCEGSLFFLIFLGAGLQIDLLVPGQPSIAPYVMSIFLSAAFFYLSALKMFALFGLAWSIWMFMVWQVSTDLRFPVEMAISGTLGTVMAMIIARASYASFVKDFLSWRMIERHKQNQKELKILTQISARLAHEIRNPLTSAGGFARRISSSMPPDDPNRPKAEIIVKEVERMEAILRMIQDYLEPLKLNISPIDPNQLVNTALHSVDGEIKKRKVRLASQLKHGIPKISVDPELLVQGVEVLLKNALKQMPDGAILYVETLQENNMFKLVMRYPARHMSARDVEDFFYPFTTSHTAHEGGNHTVDLPKSRILVEKHGGEISVTLQNSNEILLQLSLPLTSISLVGVHKDQYASDGA